MVGRSAPWDYLAARQDVTRSIDRSSTWVLGCPPPGEPRCSPSGQPYSARARGKLAAAAVCPDAAFSSRLPSSLPSFGVRGIDPSPMPGEEGEGKPAC